MSVAGIANPNQAQWGPSQSKSEGDVLDVLIIGAGLSGIGVAAHLRRKAPWARYAILEARDSIGGTWDLFRYPGIRSDSDMYSFSYCFNPWNGSQAIADGSEILAYLKETARREGLMGDIHYHHRVKSARWSSSEALWRVSVEVGAKQIEMATRLLVGATGYYRYECGYQPDFPGADQYQGRFVHPQLWPDGLDWVSKRVVVIGSGATAITLVPSLAEKASHVVMVQRSPTYVISRPAQDPPAQWLEKVLPVPISGSVLRWINALFLEASYRYSRRSPERMKAFIRSQAKRQLPDGFDVDKHFKPVYDPWDQRLCVARDGDLFKAIRQGRVTVVTDRIATFTQNGVRLLSGEEIRADIVVSATGLELEFMGGIELEVDEKSLKASDRMSYKGMMLSGVPNLITVAGYINNSWTLKADLTADFVARLANRMHARHKDICVPLDRGLEPTEDPVLNLSSGYIKRGANRLPKQGPREPWRLGDSYVKDWVRIKLLGFWDPSLVLSRASSEADDQHLQFPERQVQDALAG
ncbi:MAG: NAD(P)/FAD-dependent oxidoreductase [Actinobacteria bacterium]|nr:NAD(P)/FAD-dependent oxidoreductase [Actinomycetota bacterium]